MADIILYTHPASRGRTVRWMLEECGADYETQVLDFDGAMKQPDYLAINPMGKVPALVHKGRVVTEKAAICTYLADAFPEAGLAPALDDRTDYYRWLFFAAGSLEEALMDKLLEIELSPEQQVYAGYGTFERAIEALEKHLDNRPFITGEQFSAADCVVSSLCGWAFREGVLQSDVLSSYCQSFESRPAYQKAAALDNALLAEMAK